MSKIERYREFFSWRTAVVNSDEEHSTKHVLLTLSLHMNEYGQGCFPSCKTLERETSLSERSVRTHLILAASHGWIKKFTHGVTGKGWRKYEYRLNWPDGADAKSASRKKPYRDAISAGIVMQKLPTSTSS